MTADYERLLAAHTVGWHRRHGAGAGHAWAGLLAQVAIEELMRRHVAAIATGVLSMVDADADPTDVAAYLRLGLQEIESCQGRA